MDNRYNPGEVTALCAHGRKPLSPRKYKFNTALDRALEKLESEDDYSSTMAALLQRDTETRKKIGSSDNLAFKLEPIGNIYEVVLGVYEKKKFTPIWDMPFHFPEEGIEKRLRTEEKALGINATWILNGIVIYPENREELK